MNHVKGDEEGQHLPSHQLAHQNESWCFQVWLRPLYFNIVPVWSRNGFRRQWREIEPLYQIRSQPVCFVHFSPSIAWFLPSSIWLFRADSFFTSPCFQHSWRLGTKISSLFPYDPHTNSLSLISPRYFSHFSQEFQPRSKHSEHHKLFFWCLFLRSDLQVSLTKLVIGLSERPHLYMLWLSTTKLLERLLKKGL